MIKKLKYFSLLAILSFFLVQCGDFIDKLNSSSGNLVGNTQATLVMGQGTFGSVTSGVSSSAFTSPNGIYFDNTKVFIADAGAHRVLIYNSFPATSGTGASVVVGQTATGNSGINASGTTVAANGFNFLPNQAHVGVFSDGISLYVPDTANHRVLIFTIPTATGPNNNASVIVGQPNGTTATLNNKNGGGAGVVADKASLNNPTAVFVDRGRMYIVDSGNHRILVFNSVPTINHKQADFVIGQKDFNTIGANHNNQLNTNGSQSLNNPQGIWVTGNRLFVADSGNNRVLVFNVNTIGNNPVGGNDPVAIGVAGQTNFTNTGLGNSSTTLSNPVDVTSNNATNIIVADKNNHRIMIWTSVPTGGTSAGAANSVIGQVASNFTNNQANRGTTPANNSVNSPGGVFDNISHLLIADTNNNRVTRFKGQ